MVPIARLDGGNRSRAESGCQGGCREGRDSRRCVVDFLRWRQESAIFGPSNHTIFNHNGHHETRDKETNQDA